MLEELQNLNIYLIGMMGWIADPLECVKDRSQMARAGMPGVVPRTRA